MSGQVATRVVLVVLFLSLLGVICWPLGGDSPEDRGDGLGHVRIPSPTKTPRTRPRTYAFFVGIVVVTVLTIGLRSPSPVSIYIKAVKGMATAASGSPTQTAGYTSRMHPTVPFLASFYLVVLAAVLRGSAARRIALAAHALLFLAISAVFQALVIVTAISASVVARPFGFESLVVELGLGALVNARAIFTTFILPRHTALTNTRPKYRWDTALAVSAMVFAVCVVVIGFSWLASLPAGSVARVLVPIYGITIIFLLSPLALLPFGWLAGERPAPRSDIPIDVITPAFNEEAGIRHTLESIDDAAMSYGGPVRVFVSNDGSTDMTEHLALTAIDRFRAAEGVVISEANGGKAEALNRALARTSAEIVVRIDGDCVMGIEALKYSAGWFDDPTIGSVGALMMPRLDSQSWFHRLRGIECLFQFGLARRGEEVIDAMTVIPGTYTAFRREPALAMGGFVDGMNGEDSELTMQLGRMGYRAVLDPRIRCFEDVPPTVGSFLEQRTRWSRGGLHVAARHSPARSGLAGPRIWLMLVRRMFAWLSIMLGLAGPIYLAVVALLEPSDRRTVGSIVGLYLVAAGLYLLLSVGLVIHYRQWRLLPWIVTWYPFAILRRIAMLEALLSLPVRPLSLSWPRSACSVPRHLEPVVPEARAEIAT